MGRNNQFRYYRLADEIESKIDLGVYKSGEKLPSIRTLRVQTGFSMTTVYQAFIELERRGRIVARQKSGYYVKPLACQLLPGPKATRLKPTARKVSINSLATSIVTAMGDPTMLKLGGTLVAPELLPLKALSQHLKRMPTANLMRKLDGYAHPAGNKELRRQIAKRGVDLFQQIHAEDIVVTNGCIEAVSLCLRATANPGDTIAVESPTYPWFLQVIEDLKMLALELPTDPFTGLDLAAFEKATQTHNIKACLLVPNFQNPLGCIMPNDHKAHLVKMANDKEIPIIEDDIHGELYFGSSRPSTLKSFDKKGLVLYCTSVSKSLTPGLRLGWVIAGKYLSKVLQLKLNTTIAVAGINQYLLTEYLKGGSYNRHLRRLRTTLKNQVNNTAMAIARYFPEGTRLSKPKGGLMLWVQLPGKVDSLEVFHAARRQQIAIMPGIMCATTPRYRNCIRISCGFPWSDNLDKGILVLGKIVANLKK
jgi:DNA-binding transcriptional MocR family regulator